MACATTDRPGRWRWRSRDRQLDRVRALSGDGPPRLTVAGVAAPTPPPLVPAGRRRRSTTGALNRIRWERHRFRLARSQPARRQCGDPASHDDRVGIADCVPVHSRSVALPSRGCSARHATRSGGDQRTATLQANSSARSAMDRSYKTLRSTTQDTRRRTGSHSKHTLPLGEIKYGAHDRSYRISRAC
jgi:hypothetical protein